MRLFIYAVLLLLGLVLSGLTVARVLLGGIAEPSDRTKIRHGSSGGGARRILDERYAAGEMSTEEYQHRLRVLEGRS